MQNLGIDVNIVVSKLEGKKPAEMRTTFKTTFKKVKLFEKLAQNVTSKSISVMGYGLWGLMLVLKASVLARFHTPASHI